MEEMQLLLRSHSRQSEEEKYSGFFLSPALAPKASVPHCPNILRNHMGKGIWEIYLTGASPVLQNSRVRVGDRSKGQEASAQHT